LFSICAYACGMKPLPFLNPAAGTPAVRNPARPAVIVPTQAVDADELAAECAAPEATGVVDVIAWRVDPLLARSLGAEGAPGAGGRPDRVRRRARRYRRERLRGGDAGSDRRTDRGPGALGRRRRDRPGGGAGTHRLGTGSRNRGHRLTPQLRVHGLI